MRLYVFVYTWRFLLRIEQKNHTRTHTHTLEWHDNVSLLYDLGRYTRHRCLNSKWYRKKITCPHRYSSSDNTHYLIIRDLLFPQIIYNSWRYLHTLYAQLTVLNSKIILHHGLSPVSTTILYGVRCVCVFIWSCDLITLFLYIKILTSGVVECKRYHWVTLGLVN